jgi:superfamily I DNA/RNA helicase
MQSYSFFLFLRVNDVFDREFENILKLTEALIPLHERIESISDEADLEEVYTTERYLLYVACPRAREDLLVTATKSESEFLIDGFEDVT